MTGESANGNASPQTLLPGSCETRGCPSAATELTVDTDGGLHALCPWCAADAMEGRAPRVSADLRHGRVVTVAGVGPAAADHRPAVTSCPTVGPEPRPWLVVDEELLLTVALAASAVLAGAGAVGLASSWARGPLAVAPWCAAGAVGASLGWLVARVRRQRA